VAEKKTDKGLHDSAPKEGPVSPVPPERPYAEAMTAEQKKALKDAGLL
jgi:hypothetical protein